MRFRASVTVALDTSSGKLSNEIDKNSCGIYGRAKDRGVLRYREEIRYPSFLTGLLENFRENDLPH